MVPAGGKALVKTDLSIAIPENTYARIGTSLSLPSHLPTHPSPIQPIAFSIVLPSHPPTHLPL